MSQRSRADTAGPSEGDGECETSRSSHMEARAVAKHASIRPLELTSTGPPAYPRRRRRPQHLDESLLKAVDYR